MESRQRSKQIGNIFVLPTAVQKPAQTEESKLGSFLLLASVPSFQLCLKPVAEPCFGRGEGRGQAGWGNTPLSAHPCRSWQLATGEGSQTELNCAPLKAPPERLNLALSGFAPSPQLRLRQRGREQQSPGRPTDAARGFVPAASATFKKLPRAQQESQEPRISLLTLMYAFQHMGT